MPPITPNTAPKTLAVTQDTTINELNTFLDSAKTGEKVFGTRSIDTSSGKAVEVKTLYLAKSAGGSGNLEHDANHSASFPMRRKTAYTHMATILQNAINKSTDNANTRFEDNRDFRNDLRTLLTSYVDREIKAPHSTRAQHNAETDALTPKDAKDMAKVTKKPVDRANDIKANMDKFRMSSALPDTENVALATSHEPEINGTKYPNLVGTKFPDLRIGDQDFKAQRVLGAGGNGIAVLYENEATGTSKVVKFTTFFDTERTSLSPIDQRRFDIDVENATHELAAGAKFAKDTKSTMRFDDHVKLDNGAVVLIGDVAKHGDLSDFSKVLNDVRNKELISPHAHRLITLTMTLDTADGVDAIHKADGLHGDMKPNNQVIGADGKARIIDFGLSAKGPTVSKLRDQAHAFGGQHYNAPEAMLRETKVDTDRFFADLEARNEANRIKAEFNALADELDGPESGTGTAQKLGDKHLNLFKKAEFNREADRYAVDAKADVFGIGQTTYALTKGEWVANTRLADIKDTNPPEAKDDKAVRDIAKERKVALASDDNSHGVNLGGGTPFANHALVGRTDDPVIDLLLDDVLAPNPQNRPSVQELRDHQSMQYGAKDGKPAIGSDEVRALILAIASGDEEKIQEKAKALEDAFEAPSDLSSYTEALKARSDAKADLTAPGPVATMVNRTAPPPPEPTPTIDFEETTTPSALYPSVGPSPAFDLKTPVISTTFSVPTQSLKFDALKAAEST